MDLVSWTFKSSKQYNQSKPLYINALDSTQSLSANQCRTLVRQLVSGLQTQGIQTGDTVCVLSFNSIHYAPLYLGIIGSGGCFTGANPGYTAHELAHHLKITQAKYFLFEPKTFKVAVEAAKSCGLPTSKLFILDTQDETIPVGYQSWRQLLEHGEKDWVSGIDASETTAAYVSTSGTSGLPKAAILTHSYMVSQAEVIGRVTGGDQNTPQLVVTPPFHVFTMPVQHGIPLKQGTPCYIMARYEQKGFLNAVESFKIARTVVVPPLLPALGRSADAKSLESLRSIFVGGCCATDGMQQQLYDRLHPEASILQVYGLTETGWATVWQEKHKDESGSVGMPLPGTKFRVVGLNGRIVKRDGVEGEIHVKPPHPMKGYLNNASGTADAFSEDGWVRTGDVGYVKEGRWYVIDRTKDLIKVRGWQVSPAEIETVLVEHPEIADAAVIGIAARDGTGEVPQGFIVRAQGSQIQEEDVRSFLGERLARYKQVDEVVFVDRIPRNPTGKILRRVLRAERQPQMPTPDQEAAIAYSNALREMQKKELARKSRSPSDGESSKTHSRTASLTDASTIASSNTHSRNTSLTDASTIASSNTHSRNTSLTDASTIASSKAYSRTASLTDASTIESGLLSPAIELSEVSFEGERKNTKRKGDELELQSMKPKRRRLRSDTRCK